MATWNFSHLYRTDPNDTTTPAFFNTMDLAGGHSDDPSTLTFDGEASHGEACTLTVDGNTYNCVYDSRTADGSGVLVRLSDDTWYLLTADTVPENSLFGTDSAVVDFGGTPTTTQSFVCYAAGTRIMTDRGEVAIEDLCPGDRVATLDADQPGLLPVVWIGKRRVDLTRYPNADQVAPVRIARGAFAENVPARDLIVSPPHAIYMDGRLIPAKLLVNDMTITREYGMREITYYHVELERHAVILAEGLPAESYLDTGNRAFFGNAAVTSLAGAVYHVDDASRVWQEQACAPLAVAPDDVRPFWEALADTAEALGYVRPSVLTTTDPDMHLLVDGRRINPVSVVNRTHSFVLPRLAREVRLASRATAPSRLSGWIDDDRSLGVALHRLTITDAGGQSQTVAADDPVLTKGWYAPERQGTALWRWSNGDAVLPVSGRGNACILEVRIADSATYILRKEPAARIAA